MTPRNAFTLRFAPLREAQAQVRQGGTPSVACDQVQQTSEAMPDSRKQRERQEMQQPEEAQRKPGAERSKAHGNRLPFICRFPAAHPRSSVLCSGCNSTDTA